jgi:hypothetical protein
MDEALYRGQQTVQRVFGPHAVLTGSIGSGRGPGVVEIKADGRTLGRGPNFEQALADVTTRATAIHGRAVR